MLLHVVPDALAPCAAPAAPVDKLPAVKALVMLVDVWCCPPRFRPAPLASRPVSIDVAAASQQLVSCWDLSEELESASLCRLWTEVDAGSAAACLQ